MSAGSRSPNFTNRWMIPATFSNPSTAPCAATTASGRALTAATSVTFTTWVLSRSTLNARDAVCASPASLTSTAATRAPAGEQPPHDLLPDAVAATGDDEHLVADAHVTPPG